MIVEEAQHVKMLLNELKSFLKIKEGKGKEVKEGGQCTLHLDVLDVLPLVCGENVNDRLFQRIMFI